MGVLSPDGNSYQIYFDTFTQGYSTIRNYILSAGANIYVQGIIQKDGTLLAKLILTMPR